MLSVTFCFWSPVVTDSSQTSEADLSSVIVFKPEFIFWAVTYCNIDLSPLTC